MIHTLNVHETVHCQNTREMLADGDWVVPHYADRPWLERPPLPFWITAGFVATLGDHDWVYLLPPMLLGAGIVLLTAGMATSLFGRPVGFVTGAVLATSHEFLHYVCGGAEADIFLCYLVTLALALFVRVEFGPTAGDQRRGFVGRRPAAVLGLFVVLGLTNLTKGLAFGMVLALLPIGGFLLVGRPAVIRRYVWLWGWLAVAAAALPWPVLVCYRLPDAIDFWKNDYVFRAVTEDAESGWYYIRTLPWMLLPWSPFALAGAWLMHPRPGSETNRQRTFVAVWAILPIAVLTLSRHKHHHYLLHGLAPWAMYAAAGVIRTWEWLAQPSAAPRPSAFWRRGPVALAITLAVLCGGRFLMDLGQRLFFDHYKDDRAFLERMCATVPPGQPILVDGRDGALTGSWWLHYGHGRTRLLHNLTFLRDDRLGPSAVYVIARRCVAPALATYGVATAVLESRHSRQEYTPDRRYTLFRLVYRPDLVPHRPTCTSLPFKPPAGCRGHSSNDRWPRGRRRENQSRHRPRLVAPLYRPAARPIRPLYPALELFRLRRPVRGPVRRGRSGPR